jgi:tartrate dehydratase beta subunit/fumarate hydratase class I family protein
VKDPVRIEDLHATLYRALGIPATLAYEVEERPFYVTSDGKGQAIGSLFA